MSPTPTSQVGVAYLLLDLFVVFSALPSCLLPLRGRFRQAAQEQLGERGVCGVCGVCVCVVCVCVYF